MSEISLDDGTIYVDNGWLGVEELARRIQDKIQAGDMKLTTLASALEELNTALENSQTIDVRVVLANEDYEKLKAFGGEDDRESVRKAIMNFVAADGEKPDKKQIKKAIVKCPQCMAPITIPTDERPVVVECEKCGTSGRLTAQNRWAKLDEA